MFLENISNVKNLLVLDLSWEGIDKSAEPRPYHALSFRIKGNAEFTFKGEKLKAESNDIIFVPEGIGYHIKGKDEKLFCIHFLADGVPTDKILKFKPSNSLIFGKLFSNIFEHWIQRKSGYYVQSISDFYKIISKIQFQQSETKFITSRGDIAESVQYIHEHFTETDITIGKIAEASNLSESHFRKLFGASFGVSPLKYLNELRVAYAKELVESGYYKIYEIANMSGFADVKYFSTVLKKATGSPPSGYKKKS